jgi:hypothetical protein
MTAQPLLVQKQLSGVLQQSITALGLLGKPWKTSCDCGTMVL